MFLILTVPLIHGTDAHIFQRYDAFWHIFSGVLQQDQLKYVWIYWKQNKHKDLQKHGAEYLKVVEAAVVQNKPPSFPILPTSSLVDDIIIF